MEFDIAEEDFKQLVKENILIPSIAKTFDATEKLIEDYLNPFVESNYIEGFDTEFNEDTKGFHLLVHFADEKDLEFSVAGVIA